MGSPPQVRGKPHHTQFIRIKLRITPAGAGKTICDSVNRFCIWDHPRRCGENANRKIKSRESQGSPPQVRGKQKIKLGQDYAIGITPAGAGKTPFTLTSIIRSQDHPRRCGENQVVFGRRIRGPGSPPQVRGKQLKQHCTECCARITPAGAGKTLKRSFRNQPFCSRAVQISFNFSNSLNVSLQSGSAR